jgi:sterol 3beta-glucosyltransferase
MRWPRIIRKSLTLQQCCPSHNNTNRDDDNMHDGSPEDLSLKSSRPHDPGLSQIFSDAALYERVLSACPESLNSGFHFGEEDQTLPKCLGGFNELVGRDLGDVERAISGKLATLTVNNWTSPEDTPSTPDTLSDEEPGENISTEDGAGENQPSLPTLSVSEEDSELPQPKLTPSEVIGLLEDEFGALAPPGEERLLLETDAAFLRDVIVLVSDLSPGTFRTLAYVFLL